MQIEIARLLQDNLAHSGDGRESVLERPQDHGFSHWAAHWSSGFVCSEERRTWLGQLGRYNAYGVDFCVVLSSHNCPDIHRQPDKIPEDPR